MRPDRSKVVDLFSTDLFEAPIKTPIKRPQNRNNKVKATDSNKARFLLKLSEGEFNAFDHKDWFNYFCYKASEHGVKYITRNYAKEYAIIKSIMGEMSYTELKDMIDFVFDSPQDIVEKQTVGLWILSKGWINTIYQNTLLWKQGKYKPKTPQKRNREWQPELAEASRKDSGISYGKPIRESEEPAKAKKGKSGSIRL